MYKYEVYFTLQIAFAIINLKTFVIKYKIKPKGVVSRNAFVLNLVNRIFFSDHKIKLHP